MDLIATSLSTKDASRSLGDQLDQRARRAVANQRRAPRQLGQDAVSRASLRPNTVAISAASSGGWRNSHAVSLSRRSPRARARWALPRAPTAATSLQRCSTRTWLMPRARANFHEPCNQRSDGVVAQQRPGLVEDEVARFLAGGQVLRRRDRAQGGHAIITRSPRYRETSRTTSGSSKPTGAPVAVVETREVALREASQE